MIFEVWLPGQNTFKEISSCSNLRIFSEKGKDSIPDCWKEQNRVRPYPQRFRTSGGRTLVAILENYQQADGSVIILKCYGLTYSGRKK